MREKVAFVTGSTRGIGLAAAQQLFADGYRVILSSSKPRESLPQPVFNLLAEQVTYIQCDIADAQQRAAAFRTLEEAYGRLDLLVNNAGVACKERLDILETTAESVDQLLDINLKGTFYMCQLAANFMLRQLAQKPESTPRIINVSSISAYTSSVSRGEYCISKAGISMVTKLFADRLAAYGIPVFEVRPGIIATDMTQAVQASYAERIQKQDLLPIKRMGTPEDVARCIAAAASGLLDYGTGTVLNADGGFHLRRL